MYLVIVKPFKQTITTSIACVLEIMIAIIYFECTGFTEVGTEKSDYSKSFALIF